MSATAGSEPSHSRGASQSESTWYRNLTAELTACGLSTTQLEQAIADTRLEATAAGVPPTALFGPAAMYARELASALREDGVIPDRRASNSTIGPVVLRLRDITVRRGRRTVLSSLSLTVRRGEIVAVVGSNGAGKSTLLQVCAGMLRARSGTVERTQRFGYAPQLDSLAPLLTVDEHIRLFGTLGDASRSRSVSTGHRILQRLGWRPDGGRVARTLSGGTQQKLNLALAQLNSPELLLLDEPYQGLDALAYEDLWTLISAWRASGAGVLLVTHLLRDIDFVDQLVELPTPEDSAKHLSTKGYPT